jgi:predicted transcriptional regulator
MPPLKATMTTNEVAEILGVSPRSVKNYIYEGRLNALSFSPKNSKKKHHHVTAEQLTQFINNSSLQSSRLRNTIKREL